MIERKSRIIRLISFDLVFLVLLFVWMTGGSFFLSDSMLEIIRSKPWTHRLGSTFVALILLGMGYFCVQRQRNNNSSYLYLAFQKLPLNKSSFVLLLMIVSYTSVMAYSSIVRHFAFKTGFDLAIFSQALWNTLQGDVLFSSIKGGICLLADHFSPILLALALPYAIWPDPSMLLILQALFIALSLIPLYKIASEALNSKIWGFTFCFCFMIYLPTRNSVRFDFHPELLVMPALFYAFYFIEKGQKVLSLLMIFLILTSKENAAIVTFGLFAYCTLFKAKMRIFGVLGMFFSFAYFMLVVYFIIPVFFDTPYTYLGGNYLSWFDKGIGSLLLYLFRIESWIYAIKILGPLGFLSLLNPHTFFLTLPSFVQNLSTDIEAHTSIFFQYTNFLTPFVFISAIYSIKKFKVVRITPFYVLFFSVLFMGVSELYIIEQYKKDNLSNGDQIISYAQKVEAKYSVRTNELLAPHFSNRKELHIYENNNPVEGGRKSAQLSDFIILSNDLLNSSDSLSRRKFFQVNNYISVSTIRGFEIYARSDK